MRRIFDPQILQEQLKNINLSQWFSSENLAFTLVEFASGDVITSPNRKTQQLYLMLSGDIAVRSILPDGREYLLATGSGITLLGDVEFVTDAPPSFWAQAVTPALALCLSLTTYRELLWQDNVFLRRVLHSVTEKLQSASVSEVQHGTLEQRMFGLLRRNGQDKLTHIGQTAALLHCSQRQLLRILKKCTTEGIMERTGKGVYRVLCFPEEL